MITIYRDNDANAIFIEDANGPQFLNSLQATVQNSTDCSILDLARGIDIVSSANYTEFLDENGDPYGANNTEVCNALNALFVATGSSGTELPVITSSLTASIVTGQTLNYELTADYGVGYEWDFSSVPGVVNVEGNSRRIIGGSALSAGSYNIPVKAVNYNGEDSETIVLTVSTPPFANTKSIKFENQDYLGANAALLASTLGRTSNGAGSSDAWTISFWYKPSTANQAQTIFYFGDNDATNGGSIQLAQINSSGSKYLRLRYGSNVNRLQMQTSVGSIVPGTWCHVLVTYDGGTTGSSSGSLSDYYSRFNIYVDGALPTRTDSHSNFGWSSGIDADNLRVGRATSGNYM